MLSHFSRFCFTWLLPQIFLISRKSKSFFFMNRFTVALLEPLSLTWSGWVWNFLWPLKIIILLWKKQVDEWIDFFLKPFGFESFIIVLYVTEKELNLIERLVILWWWLVATSDWTLFLYNFLFKNETEKIVSQAAINYNNLAYLSTDLICDIPGKFFRFRNTIF